MTRGEMPREERERLSEVQRLARATERDSQFLEELTRQACRFFHVPIAVITLVDRDRVWIKSRFGLDITQIKREGSLCDLAIRENAPLIIPDTHKHPVASTYPMVTTPPGIRFYAAVPIRSLFGYNVGTFCIMDVHPRTLSEQEHFVLELLGDVVSKHMELRSESPSTGRATQSARTDDLFAGGPVVLFKWRAAEGWPVEYVSHNISQFGYAASDFVSGRLPYAHIVHPADLERVVREVEYHTQRGDAAFVQEYRIVRKGGQASWVYDYTTVVRNADGNVTHYLGYILDVTARKEAETALHESWAKYEAAVEGFDGFVYLCSQDHKIEYMNRRLLNHAGANALGQECYRVIFGRRSPCPCCGALLSEEGGTVHWEGLSDLDKRWYHMVITPWRRADGSIYRLVMAQDITSRKEGEFATLRRDAILGAVAQTAQLLLRATDWRHAVPSVLAQLGQAAEADRAFVIENEASASGMITGTMSFEWTAPGVIPRMYSPVSLRIDYSSPPIRSWAETLSGGRILEALIRDVPEALRCQLREHNIQSMVMIPVFEGERWWGILGFDFCAREKRCAPIELDALRTAAVLLGTALTRLRSETALQKSHAQQRILLNAIPDLMFRLRSDGTFLDYKAERESDLAAPPDQIIGHKIQDLLPAPVAHQALVHIKRALQTNKPQTFEYDLNLRGTPKHFEARMVVSGADEVLSIVRDITAQYHNQMHLKALWSALEQMMDMVYITDIAGHFVYVNNAFERITGYTADEVAGKTPRLLKSGAHPPEFYQRIWQNLLMGQTVHVEFTNQRKDGSWYDQDTAIIPILGANNQIMNFVAVGRDITERKRTDQLMRKLAAFPEVNPNAVVELDSAAKAVYANPAAQQMATQLGCGDVSELLPPDVLEIVRRCLAQMQERRRVERVLGQRTLSWSFFPIKATHTVHAYGTDITDRLAMESQLRQLQKMEAVGRLAGGIAHDFNNILTAIMGYASILQSDESLSANAREHVQEISAAAERASNLTRRLLTFSRRQIMQRAPVSINAVLEHLGCMLKRLIHENITLEFALADNLPEVAADAVMLEQVITNMVINARDAMPAGGKIRISTRLRTWKPEEVQNKPEAAPGPSVCIEIADEGCGMTDDVKSRLFEPFFTTKEKGRGTGLGLATAYGIVRQHDGWIDVESEAGRGTVFRVYLPVRETVAQAQTPKSSTRLRRGREIILMVEDDDRVRMLGTTVLAAAGYTVLPCGSGEEALELWKKHGGAIDMLVTDIVMPGSVSGFDLADRLHREKPNLKVVLVSGYDQESSTMQFPRRCPYVFLPKPFSPDELLKTLAQVFDSPAPNRAD